MTLDIDTLEEIATQSLTEPSDAYFWDERLFKTHGAILSWASRGDDILEESNYKSALELIKGAAGDDADEHVIDGSASHWLVGSLETIYVKVYADTPECNTIGCEADAEYLATQRGYEDGHFCGEHKEGLEGTFLAELLGVEFEPLTKEFTPAFIEAAEIISGLQDYPIVDESDFSEREYERFEVNLQEAIGQAQREYVDDSNEDEEAILELARDDLSELFGYEGNAEVSWGRVEEIYGFWRDEYFTVRANEALNAPIEGQQEIDVLVLLVQV